LTSNFELFFAGGFLGFFAGIYVALASVRWVLISDETSIGYTKWRAKRKGNSWPLSRD
jgi:hypothetical protein